MSLLFLGLHRDLLNLHDSMEQRMEARQKRAEENPTAMVKTAFDTRRINQEEQFNPRRNLQNFQRSEPFITPEMSQKVRSLFKVKQAADTIREQFIGDPDWLDSNSRILCNALNNTLRVDQGDYDFFKPQFDYLDELLYLRYRLASDDIDKLSEREIKDRLLDKDERLLHKALFSNYRGRDGHMEKTSDREMPILKQTVVSQEDSLMEKLFGNVKATHDKKNVKRSVTISISDSIDDQVAKAEAALEDKKTEE